MIVILLEILIVLMLLGGVVLLIFGLRGRRVDDHPICRRCGFDLFGRPEGSNVCSECGANLAHPHAIRDGRRVRRGNLLVAGATMLAIVLSVGGGAAWLVLSSSNWREYMPVWYLLSEADGLNAKARDAALAELSARLTANQLSQQQIDALADQALAIQADRKRAWVPAWGDLIENAEAANKLSKERFEKYLLQAPNLKFAIRKELRRGDKLPYWIIHEPARVGSKTSFTLNTSLTDWTIGSVHHKLDGYGGGGSQLSVTGAGSTGSALELKPEDIAAIPDGPQTFKAHFELKVQRGWQSSSPALASSSIDMSGTFNLHPAGEPTAVLHHDPSLRAGVAKALSVSYAQYGQSWNPKYLNITIMVNGLPVGIGYDIYARINGKEQKIGEFACPKGTDNHGWSCGADVSNFTSDTIDIVLKPSLDSAIATIDTFEVWDEPIELKGIKVQRPAPPATKPAPTTTMYVE